MNKKLAFFAMACVLAIGAGLHPATAQLSTSSVGNGNAMGQGAATNTDVHSEDNDRIYREQLLKLRTKRAAKATENRATMIKDSSQLVGVLQLGCDVADVSLLGTATETIKGQSVATTTYEVACGNGMGYLIVGKGNGDVTGYSCFQAEAQREAAAAKHQTFEGVCVLPANETMAQIVGAVLTHVGTQCTVSKAQWMGQSDKTGMEYVETLCGDGKGYVLATPIPGSPGKTAAISCAEAATNGLACTMTKVAAAPAATGATDTSAAPTLEGLAGALKQHGVSCTVADLHADMRVIGKETHRGRHVVEFKCPEQPKGLVAMIPWGDNPNPFQTVDCDAAKKAGMVCKLN